MLKKSLATLAVGAIALTGLGMATATSATAATPTTHTHVAGVHAASQHPLRAWLRTNRAAIARAGITVSATTIGITPKQLRTELRTGKSIAQVATAHGTDPQAVITALTSAADARVAQAVTAGTLTAAQGAKIDAALPARITKQVNRVHAVK